MRRTLTRKLVDTLRQWETLFDVVPDMIAILDNDDRFLRVNKAMAASMGYRPEDLIGRRCCERRAGELPIVENYPNTLLLCDEDSYPSPNPRERIKGHYLIRTLPLRDSDGRVVARIHISRDISELQRGRDELAAANRRNERLMANMSSFLLELDADLLVMRWNPAAESTFGLSAAEVVGRRVMNVGIAADWPEIEAMITVWSSREDPFHLVDQRYRRPDGSDGFLDATINRLYDAHGVVNGYLVLGNDTTERRSRESQQLQARKLESIGHMASGLAHEINTPAQYISNNLEFLERAMVDLERVRLAQEALLKVGRNGGIDGDVLGDVESVLSSVNVSYLVEQVPLAIAQSLEGVSRVASVVNAMKKYSESDGDKKILVDLNDCIASTLTLSRREWESVATLETCYDDQLPPVPCLPGPLNQAVLNIIQNAAHSIAEKQKESGRVMGVIRIETLRGEQWVEVRISDTGTGIPMQIEGRVFDPFFTTKGVGRWTGQGLAIAHNAIVEKHGGSLTFRSRDGEGTTFFVRLPTAEVANESIEAYGSVC
jgi:two-component system, NtrC family, sensor kinase